MSSNIPTERKTKNYQVWIVIIGILVALGIGLSLSAFSFKFGETVTVMIRQHTSVDLDTILKIGSAGVETINYLATQLRDYI